MKSPLETLTDIERGVLLLTQQVAITQACADRLASTLQMWVDAEGGDAWVWPESGRRTALIESREAIALHEEMKK